MYTSCLSVCVLIIVWPVICLKKKKYLIFKLCIKCVSSQREGGGCGARWRRWSSDVRAIVVGAALLYEAKKEKLRASTYPDNLRAGVVRRSRKEAKRWLCWKRLTHTLREHSQQQQPTHTEEQESRWSSARPLSEETNPEKENQLNLVFFVKWLLHKMKQPQSTLLLMAHPAGWRTTHDNARQREADVHVLK